MKVSVGVIGKHDFINKKGTTSYVLELVDFDNKRVYRAFTSKNHYEHINENSTVDGYVSFENGFTKFYLPKDEVNSNG